MVQRIIIENGLCLSKRTKKKRIFQYRERRPCIGELVQIDGSEHAWFENRGPKSSLLMYIGDATNRVHLHFAKSENMWDCYKGS